MSGWRTQAKAAQYDSLCLALRESFPHFQDSVMVTADTIRGIGREYQEMVMGWAPFKTEIEFVDCVGHPGKLTFEDDVWGYDGVLPL